MPSPAVERRALSIRNKQLGPCIPEYLGHLQQLTPGSLCALCSILAGRLPRQS